MAALLLPRLLAVCFFIAPIATMPGAPFYLPTDSYKVPQAARFAVAAFNAKGSPEMYAYKLTAILSSQIQLLAICFLVAAISYTRADTPAMPGAPSDVPSDRCDVRQAAWFAVAAYNTDVSQENYAYKVTTIVSSQTQVVAGLNYILTAELGLTWCLKAQATDAETCPLQVNGKRLLCRFIVYTIPWEGKAMLTEKTCIDVPLRPRCYRRSLTQGTR